MPEKEATLPRPFHPHQGRLFRYRMFQKKTSPRSFIWTWNRRFAFHSELNKRDILLTHSHSRVPDRCNSDFETIQAFVNTCQRACALLFLVGNDTTRSPQFSKRLHTKNKSRRRQIFWGLEGGRNVGARFRNHYGGKGSADSDAVLSSSAIQHSYQS